jgi:hypothetical protein
VFHSGGKVWSMDEGTIKTPIPKCHLYCCFCLEWCCHFVGSESGQTQSVKLLENMVYNTVCLMYLLYVYCGGGQREGRGATVHKRDRKYQHALLYLQCINSSKDDIWGLVSLWFLRKEEKRVRIQKI